jgi:eukaryotic-like serine/threonine-protein kinase
VTPPLHDLLSKAGDKIPTMDPDAVRSQLQRILRSAAFSDAERGSRFLRFVVEAALDGRANEIKESVIGVEVLARSTSFDPKTDPIVRVEAGRLRARLSAYYESEGKGDSLLISLPKGRYVPDFAMRQTPKPQNAWRAGLLVTAGVLFGFAIAYVAALYHRRAPDSGKALRLTILPPENSSFESFAVSPDGRKLAFTAAFNGKLMLWVRWLDSLDAKPLPGTENAAYPFWSPDGRSIGFFALPHKLKTIPVAGGPSQDIADVILGRGGTWSPEGVIVFCPRPIGPLYQVAATGGSPKAVTSLDETRSEVFHGSPQFLPDGRHFLYLAASSRPGESSIRVGSLDSHNSKILLSADTSAEYAPMLPRHPGSLLLADHGALMAQPFDLGRLEATGERTVVAEQVRYRRWQKAGFSVSSAGVLLYQAGSAENRQFAWFDRQGKLLSTFGPSNDYGSFSLSPDDKRVAVQQYDDPDTALPTIWMMDLSRQGATSRFGSPDVGEADFSPVWSPDGGEVIFSRGDDQAMRLLRQPLNGGTARIVLDTKGPKFPTDWSYDGRFVAYNSQWPDYQYQHAWIVPVSSPNSREQPTTFSQHRYEEGSVYFPPTNGGQEPLWIAYASDETGRSEVYVRETSPGTRKWRVSTQGGLLPHWRRDGRELFYLAPDGTLMAVSVRRGATFEYGAPQGLFKTGFRPTLLNIWQNQYAVSANGQRFLLDRSTESGPSVITAVIPW